MFECFHFYAKLKPVRSPRVFSRPCAATSFRARADPGTAARPLSRSTDLMINTCTSRARGRFFSASTDRLKRVCVTDYHAVCVGECKSTYTLNNKKQFKKRKRHARLSRDRFLIGRPFSISRSLFADRCHTRLPCRGESDTGGLGEPGRFGFLVQIPLSRTSGDSIRIADIGPSRFGEDASGPSGGECRLKFRERGTNMTRLTVISAYFDVFFK